MRAIGAPEDAAEHLFEHDERGVDENRFHLAREHDQGRQAARRVETRDIAGDEDGNFSCDRSPRLEHRIALDGGGLRERRRRNP